MTDQGRHLYLLFSRICGGADLEDHGIVQQKIERYKEENKMQQSVLKVQELGAPPEGFESGKPSSKKAFRIWDEWKQSLPSKSQSHGKKLKFLLNVVQLTIWPEWNGLFYIV